MAAPCGRQGSSLTWWQSSRAPAGLATTAFPSALGPWRPCSADAEGESGTVATGVQVSHRAGSRLLLTLWEAEGGSMPSHPE